MIQTSQAYPSHTSFAAPHHSHALVVSAVGDVSFATATLCGEAGPMVDEPASHVELPDAVKVPSCFGQVARKVEAAEVSNIVDWLKRPASKLACAVTAAC